MSWFTQLLIAFYRLWLGRTWNDSAALWDDTTALWDERGAGGWHAVNGAGWSQTNAPDWHTKSNSGWYT